MRSGRDRYRWAVRLGTDEDEWKITDAGTTSAVLLIQVEMSEDVGSRGRGAGGALLRTQCSLRAYPTRGRKLSPPHSSISYPNTLSITPDRFPPCKPQQVPSFSLQRGVYVVEELA